MASVISASTTSATAFNVSADTSGVLQIATGATPTTALTIDTSQNVGIGTTSPSSKLDIVGNETVSGYIRAGTGSTLAFQNNGASYNLAIAETAANTYCLGYNASTGGAVTSVLTWNQSGNVGIGTTSPSTKTMISGASTSLDTNVNAQLYIQNNTTAYNADPRAGIAFSVKYNAAGGYITGGSSIQAYKQNSTDGDYGFGMLFTTQANAAAPTERMRIDSSGYVTNTVNGLSSGLHQAQLYYRLNSGYAGSNATGAQSIFGVGVTLVGSTVYEFEMVFQLTRASGTTSHTISLGFGGTATLNNIGYMEQYWFNSAGANSISGSSQGAFINTASSTVTTGAITTAAYITYVLKGTVSVNAGGTFIPQYTLSAAPGGAYTTAIGSYVKIAPLGASGATTNIGSWA